MKKILLASLAVLTLGLGSIATTAEAAEVPKVVIDAGHGGSDPGASGNGLQEKVFTLKLATMIDSHLKSNYDVETKMTRTGDTTVSLTERTNLANSWGADFFLSTHINSGGGTGYEDFTMYRGISAKDAESKRIQGVIHGEIKKVLDKYGVRDRGSKAANFHVLRETNMPSVLTETLFIDHAEDSKLLKNETFLSDIATAHSVGTAKALGLKGKTTVQPEPKPEPKPEVTPENKVYTTTDVLNVRTGAGTQNAVVTKAAKGTKVTITKTQKVGSVTWGYGTVNGKNGWMSMDYMNEHKETAAPPTTPPTTGTVPPFSSNIVPKLYDRGPLIGDLQRTLNALGYNIAVDNSFGPATNTALRDFQRKNGLSVDGRPGPATQAKFKQLLGGGTAAPQSPAAPDKPVFSSPNRVLKYGNIGADVGSLQRMLNYFGYNLAVDNSFGPGTLNALKNFQSKHGLAVDGRPGPATQAKFRALP